MGRRHPRQVIPREFLEKSNAQGLKALAVTGLFLACSLAMAIQPLMLLQVLGVVLLGLSLLSVMVLAHECGHGTLFKSAMGNEVVGWIAGLIIAVPYLPMKFLHRDHHRYLNHRKFDPTWRPWSIEEYQEKTWLERLLYRAVRGPFWWTGSLVNLVVFHFDPRLMPPEHRRSCIANMLSTAVFTVGLFIGVCWSFSLLSAVCYVIFPLLIFNAAYSSLTLLQHTVPPTSPDRIDGDTPTWYEGTSSGKDEAEHTVHLVLPPIVSWLFHHINWHVPHHVHAGIPFFNLPAAHEWLKKNNLSGIERKPDFSLLVRTAHECQLFVEDQAPLTSFSQIRTKKGLRYESYYLSN